MSTETAHGVDVHLRIDAAALTLMGLMLATQLGALAAIARLDLASVAPATPTSSPEVGGIVAAIVVVESLVLVALYACYKRAPDLLKRLLGYVLHAGLVALAIVVWGSLFLAAPVVAAVGFATTIAALYAIYVVSTYGLSWVLHDATGFALSIGFVAVGAQFVTPAPLLILIGLLLVWDYVAVSLSELMMGLIDLSASARLPNYYVIPERPGAVDLESVREFIRGDAERPANVATVIGVGDFVLPSLLVVSAAVHVAPGVAMATAGGVLVGIAALCSERPDDAADALPALLWVNTGAMAGYAAGMVMVV